MRITIGDTIDTYRVLRKLGPGAMSDVYLAYDQQNKRDVVLKFPHAHLLGDLATYERFRREVKIGFLLTHPHIQKMYILEGEKAQPYFVLEYIAGATLREILNASGTLPIETALSIGGQIADAMAYAHQHHVFHRDIKPENIIVTPDNTAKVIDFGTAFIAGARRLTLGGLGSQVGTPDYMAPEQIKGNRGDARTDIYALGITLYEVLAGHPPFEGDNALAIMNQHLTANPPPLRTFAPHVPYEIEAVILKAIRRDPAHRWPTMAAFAAALHNPLSVDLATLTKERQYEEATAPRSAFWVGIDNPLGVPLWHLVAAVCAIVLILVTFVVVSQLLHR